MRQIIYNEKDLPMKDLESIGLASGGQVLLNPTDLRALLTGGRTGMLKLKDLEFENAKIAAIDAKVSLHTTPDGKTELLLHPIYNKPVTPDFLDETQADMLEKGEVPNLLAYKNGKEMLVEYDAETREFIVSDTEKIPAPDRVNDEKLTEEQKKRYRKGKEVELNDGTIFMYAAKEPGGLLSNKDALVIASILFDGGLTYLTYMALSALFGKLRDPKEASKLSPGYYKAMQDLENQQPNFTQHYDSPVYSRKM